MKDSKILIVEDEQIIAENLRLILNSYGYTRVDVAIDAEETRELFAENKGYDLVLMDINLGEYSSLDGIDLIKELLVQYQFVYMYVTANADEKTVGKAKGTSPIGYVVKPFVNTSIYANVEMALSQINKEDLFTYTNKGMQYQIKLSNIEYLEADGAYATIYTKGGEPHFVRQSLSEFNKKYSSAFIRIHKSIIVNREHIKAYTSVFVKVNDKKLPLGRSYKSSFNEHIKNLTFF